MLGRYELRLDWRQVELPSRSAQSLLAHLILTAGTAHRREKLAGMFWPDSNELNSRSYLRHALWRIRKALATQAGVSGYIQANDISVAFDATAGLWLDVAEFERDGVDGRADEIARSVSAYGGEFLPGFYDEWAVLERERLEALLSWRMQRLVDALSRERRWPDVVLWAERWISFGGVPEGAYRALLQAHHAQGDAARMVEAYQRCADGLRRELDVTPSDATRRLYEGLTRSTSVPHEKLPASGVAAAVGYDPAPVPGKAPYKGLRHFDDADSRIFFGREALAATVAARVRHSAFLAIVGASGSGKSSLLRAGVVPVLRAAGFSVHLLTPTEHPLESLAAALTHDVPASAPALLSQLGQHEDALRSYIAASRQPVLIAVDQFEELFTLCQDAFEREAFIDGLLAAAGPDPGPAALVILTLRADFYARCAEHPGLRDAIATRQQYIGPMGQADLRRAIERPASQAMWELEPGLVDLLLHDIGDEPGALPLLSHALLETWEQRRGRTLTLHGYAASGGVRGAIAQSAERVFDRLDPDQQAIARRVFVRLTELGDGTQVTRRRAAMDELLSRGATADPVRDVLRALSEARLITIGMDAVEVAHEALIREWPRLRAWLDEDRDSLRARRDLGEAAREWDRLRRDPGALYRGLRLARALELADRDAHEWTGLERAFIEASRESAAKEERERTDTSARLQRRARYLALALSVIVAAAGAAAVFADQARTHAGAAAQEERRALSESARGAAASVASRFERLRAIVSPVGAQDIVARYEANRQLAESLFGTGRREGLSAEMQRLLASLRLVSGPDAGVLFVTDYLEDELLAVDSRAMPWQRVGDPGARIDAARRALSGTAPRMPPECAQGQRGDVWSAPYRGPEGGPELALVHYGPPCTQPFALVVEMHLRDAGSWMAQSLAAADDAYLIDATGRLVARSRRDPVLLVELAGSELVHAALSTHSTFVLETTDPMSGVSVLAAVAPVGDLGWRAVVLRERGVARDGAGGISRDVVLAAATVLVMLAGAAAVALHQRGSPRRMPAT